MPTWASGRAAHDRGGGDGGVAPARSPAVATMVVARPASSTTRRTGIVGRHSMVKWGSAILSAAARLSQIWNSSSGLGCSRSRSGNISQWTMPLPAVSHWTSPAPKRAVAPSESE